MPETPKTQQTPKRRFGGTAAQIHAALGFYKVMAFGTGTMLLLLCLEMIIRYGFGTMLMSGGTYNATGAAHGFGFVHVGSDGAAVTGGVNLSIAVLIIHGWMYVVYLVADFRLWSLMRWRFSRFVLVALGGVVPLLSFFMERKIHNETTTEVVANPTASKRY